MRKLLAITKREFRAAAANKTFIIMTILGPFLILAITILPGLLSSNPSVMGGGKPLAVTTQQPVVQAALEQAFGQQNIQLVTPASEQEGKDRVVSGDYVGYLSVPAAWPQQGAVYYSSSGTEANMFGTASGVLSAIATRLRIQEAGIPADQIEQLLAEPGFQLIRLGAGMQEEEKSENDFLGLLFTALGFVMLIYMTVLLYGQLIGRSVVQEKTMKTVEIMLSSVSARQLMFGKILGLGLAGILQYAVWVGMAGLVINFFGPALNVSLPAAVSMGNMFWLVLFFLLAFFIYAAGYAALGSAAEDEHHLGQLAWPLLIFLMIPMVLISPMVMNPGSPLVVVLSFFPMTSPIVMLVRLLVSSPAWWELALCIGLLLLTIYGLSVMAAKIFRTGILMTGKRYTFKEILRWAARR
ncbi:MAG: ABC transporter permease [Spirochaetes bacterium]|nr:ABC transporter permease [Spirochaetota bacterium]MBU0955642.1 ABC transporter permease [Spirochaetota bacterium]